MDLNGFKVFVEVVQQGSFSAAAKELNMPVSTVSRKVSDLETSIDHRLLERSTRKLRLTESGKTLFKHALISIQEMELGLSCLQEKQNQLKGRLRIALPPSLEPAWIILGAFQKKYPHVKVQVLSISRQADPISDGVDIAAQYGPTSNQSLISRNMVVNKRRLVASKEFIEKYGKPTCPADLSNFPCISWGTPATDIEWQLGDERVTFVPYAMSTEFSLLKSFALQSMGITQLPPYFCDAELASGEFVSVLDDYPSPEIIVPLLYPSRKQLSLVTRTFIDFTREYVKSVESDGWSSLIK